MTNSMTNYADTARCAIVSIIAGIVRCGAVLAGTSISVTAIGVSGFGIAVAAAEPRVCVGYNPETMTWGQIGTIDQPIGFGYCPHGYGIMGTTRVSSPDREGAKVHVMGDCCPLPEDALLDEHSLQLERCPKDSIATGAVTASILEHGECLLPAAPASCAALPKLQRQYMRCTKLSSRYQLGDPQPGVSWGWNRHLSGNFGARVVKTAIPIGLRHGIGRMEKHRWQLEGCIGSPSGSLLVAKESRRCWGNFFAQLQYAGETNDPPRGTAVQVIPECTTVTDRDSSDAACVP